MRCLRTSLLGPSDLTSFDLENDLSLRWTFQITWASLFCSPYSRLLQESLTHPGKLLFWAGSLSYFIWIQANIATTNSCSCSKTDASLIYSQRRLQFIPQMPCPLLLPQATLQHLGSELLGFLTCWGPTNAGKLSDDPLKIPERRLGQEVAHIPITQKSFQKSLRLHLFHPAFVWGTFR